MGEANQINTGLKDRRPFWKNKRWWVVAVIFAFLLVPISEIAILISSYGLKKLEFLDDHGLIAL